LSPEEASRIYDISVFGKRLPSKTSYQREKRGRWKWQEDEEEDVRSYWITLRTGEDTLI